MGDPCNISGYFWYWGDGTDEPGNATAASYTYANPGTYTVTLEVTNQAGTGTATAQAVVPESGTPSCDPPVADFTTSTSGNGANRLFTYQDTSTVSDEDNCPITAWLWTFHDNGPTDMAAAMRAYREVGFDGPMRPDHVPQMVGEDDGEPGYTMLGRLFAFGYIRGLMHATA